ncbi:MAG: Dabb family protein [Lachnospiraceae bacterium]|nr:Dabb family protein [Lachnospiraceae bacterium]
MVKHYIIWKMNEGLTEEQKAKAKLDIKTALEGLVGKIDGLEKMEIKTECFEASAGDIMMDSEFSSKEALEAYQVNPLHVDVATNIVRPNVEIRLSFDYEE